MKNTVTLLAGTNFKVGEAGKVTMPNDTEVLIDGVEGEEALIGFLQNTGSLVRVAGEKGEPDKAYMNNYDINREQFKFKRDGAGKLLTLDEQLEDGQSEDEFILGLTDDEAELSFHVLDRKKQIEDRVLGTDDKKKKDLTALAKASQKAREKDQKADEKAAKDEAKLLEKSEKTISPERSEEIRKEKEIIEDMGEVEAAKQADGEKPTKSNKPDQPVHTVVPGSNDDKTVNKTGTKPEKAKSGK